MKLRLCRLDELPDGGARGFKRHGGGRDTLFVVRRGERLNAYLNACPHVDGAPMAWRRDAYLNGDGSRIVCAAHGAQFDIDNGQCTLGPCLGQSLTPVPLDVDAEGGVHALLTETQETPS
jgi:nitrite reductase/ring-hydroxylating ferredoxin subunit